MQEQFAPAAGNIQDRQCAYSVTVRHVCATTVAVEKAVSITYSECVCSLRYPACSVRESCYTVICGLSGSTIFFQIFFREKVTEHRVRVFSLQHLSETSHSMQNSVAYYYNCT